jgi:hypothetical protein
MTGYYDSLRGLIPVKLVRRFTPALPYIGKMVNLEVTADRSCYKKGDVIETSPERYVCKVGNDLAMMCRTINEGEDKNK